MKKWLLTTVVALALLFTSGTANADVLIQAQCNVTLAGVGSCTFTNTGNSPGSGCATLLLRNRVTGASTSSSVVCSGRIEPSTTGQPVAISIVGPTVIQTCDGPGATAIGTFCDLTVQVSNLQDLGTPAGALFWFLVAIPSALFMFWDARRRMMPSPVQYLVGGLFLWIIAVPWFLIARRNHPVGGPPIPPTAFQHTRQ